MHLLGIIRGRHTLFLVLFLGHFTDRSDAQAASDLLDMDISTVSPPQDTFSPCKGDRMCTVKQREFDRDIQFTDVCSRPKDVPFAKLKDEFLEQTVFPKDTIISYDCQTGYEHVPGAEGTATCMDGGVWSLPDTFCKPNFCGPPPRHEYGIPKEENLERTVFPTGTEIKYVCRLGYFRIPLTSAVVTCLPDNTWSTPKAFCKRRSCSNPGEVENGRMQDAENFEFGSRVTYVCNTGYKMISKRNYRDCLEDGKWSNDLPVCTVVFCPSPPNIANGHYYPEKAEYSYLDSVKYICVGKLALIGQQTISCTEEGKWSSSAPDCKVVQCSNPNVDNAIKLSGFRGPYNMNSLVRFGCRQQYKLIGSDTVTCNQNSEWEPELPKCVGICQSVPRILYAELVEPTTEVTFLEGTTLHFRCIQGYEPLADPVYTVKCSALRWSYTGTFCKPITCVEPEPVPHGRMISGSFTYKSRITYTCETGYIIKNKERTCLSNQSWSLPVPECEVQTCPNPGYVANGSYDLRKDKYIYNDTVTYDCDEGFQLIGQASITCHQDGRWNYQTPVCKGICNAPPDLHYAQLQSHNKYMDTFISGTTIQYVCKPGFYRDYRFTDSITCLGNFTWSKLSNEFCQIYTCPTPTYVRNGFYDPAMQEYFYNDTITYDCEEGFQLVGQALLTCVEGGRWNYNPPECKGICDNPPDLHYAELDFSYKHMTTFFVGNSVRYNCKPGYIQKYMYPNTISCLGNLTWSKIHNEFCNRIYCISPPKLPNAIFEAKDFLFESEAVYKCEKGFKMISQSKSMKCGANGRWTGPLPGCKVQKCSPPEDLEGGSYSIKKDEYTYNDSVTYKCNTLQLVGKALVSCSDDGKWSSGAPQCKAVCTLPPELDFAVVEEEFINQDFFDSGKTVQYKCRPGFASVNGKSNKLTCLNNLKWSQHEVFCTRISCGNPGTIDYGQMQSENFLFGSRVNYTCDSGYSMISRRNYRECQADGTWSGKPPVCKQPVCENIWELQEEARKCTSTPDEWIKYLQVQLLYLQIENLKLDIEIKKQQLEG